MILKNITNIWQRINDAEQRFNRTSGAVDLMVVSKARSVDEIKEALEAGAFHFGENYVQEALGKMKALSGEVIDWHYIGNIQSNKTRHIAENFSWVHTVSSEKAAGRLSMHRPSHLPSLNVCLEVNISHETSKSGAQIDELSRLAETVANLPHLRLRGLMAIPVQSDTFEAQRAVFREVFALYRKLVAEGYTLDTLSMGMSGDFEAAIAEGATIVRLGTAIFGPRK